MSMDDISKVTNSTQSAIQLINQRTDDDQVAIFDPRIKFASKKEEADAAIVWSSKSVDLAYQAIEEGQGLRVSPFYKNNPNLRKANLLFQYTEEELMEIVRCRNDINYFAEKYVFLKTENGLQHIKLRPYQKNLLKTQQDNRWSIICQARQSGKCLTFINNLKIREKVNDNVISKHKVVKLDIGVLYNYIKCKQGKLSIKDKLVAFLWKLYKHLETCKRKK